MTKAEAKKLGQELGKDHAEMIYTDTPYQRLADTLNKYKTKKAWSDRADSYVTEHARVPKTLENDFKGSFAASGIKAIKQYIAEALSDGYLKEI